MVSVVFPGLSPLVSYAAQTLTVPLKPLPWPSAAAAAAAAASLQSHH